MPKQPKDRKRPKEKGGPNYTEIYKIRRRCPLCGMIPNDSNRFTWEHHFQTWEVVFGPVAGQTGRGGITYTAKDDPEYIPMMRDAVRKLAPRLGLVVEGPE